MSGVYCVNMIKIDADKFQHSVILFLRATIILALVGAAWNQRWSLVFSSAVILFLTFIPHFFENRYNINLPLEFEFVIIVFLYAALFLGEVHAYYAKYWWWDIALHTSSGIALGFAGFLILYLLYYQGKIKARPIWIAVFAFCFALALGALWEIFEFAGDQLIGSSMQNSGLVDTMWDLIVDALGALLTSFIGYFYIKGHKTPLFTRFLEHFVKENPRFFHQKKK